MLCNFNADDLYHWDNLTKQYIGSLTPKAQEPYNSLRAKYPEALICVGNVIATGGYHFYVLRKSGVSAEGTDAGLVEDTDLFGTWEARETGVCGDNTFACYEYASQTEAIESVTIIDTQFALSAVNDLEACVF